jgi:hypothetical protein
VKNDKANSVVMSHRRPGSKNYSEREGEESMICEDSGLFYLKLEFNKNDSLPKSSEFSTNSINSRPEFCSLIARCKSY